MICELSSRTDMRDDTFVYVFQFIIIICWQMHHGMAMEHGLVICLAAENCKLYVFVCVKRRIGRNIVTFR